jgi:hypothetical protein
MAATQVSIFAEPNNNNNNNSYRFLQVSRFPPAQHAQVRAADVLPSPSMDSPGMLGLGLGLGLGLQYVTADKRGTLRGLAS